MSAGNSAFLKNSKHYFGNVSRKYLRIPLEISSEAFPGIHRKFLKLLEEFRWSITHEIPMKVSLRNLSLFLFKAFFCKLVQKTTSISYRLEIHSPGNMIPWRICSNLSINAEKKSKEKLPLEQFISDWWHTTGCALFIVSSILFMLGFLENFRRDLF